MAEKHFCGMTVVRIYTSISLNPTHSSEKFLLPVRAHPFSKSNLKYTH